MIKLKIIVKEKRIYKNFMLFSLVAINKSFSLPISIACIPDVSVFSKHPMMFVKKRVRNYFK